MDNYFLGNFVSFPQFPQSFRIFYYWKSPHGIMYVILLGILLGLLLGAFNLSFPHRLFVLVFRAIRTLAQPRLLPVPPSMRCFLLASFIMTTAITTTGTANATALPDAIPALHAATEHVDVMMTTRRNSTGGASAGHGVVGSFQVPMHRRDTGIAMVKSIEPVGPMWATPVMIGDQKFRVLIDTGSADLWVSLLSFLCLFARTALFFVFDRREERNLDSRSAQAENWKKKRQFR